MRSETGMQLLRRSSRCLREIKMAAHFSSRERYKRGFVPSQAEKKKPLPKAGFFCPYKQKSTSRLKYGLQYPYGLIYHTRQIFEIKISKAPETEVNGAYPGKRCMSINFSLYLFWVKSGSLLQLAVGFVAGELPLPLQQTFFPPRESHPEKVVSISV